MSEHLFRETFPCRAHKRLTLEPEAREWLQHRLRLLVDQPDFAQKVRGALDPVPPAGRRMPSTTAQD